MTATKDIELRREFVMEEVKRTYESAENSVKLLATLNAGGLVALLGFLSAIAGKDKKVLPSVAVLIEPMTWFSVGIIAAAAASCLMYGANYFYARSSETWLLNVDYARGYSKFYAGRFFHMSTLAALLGSFLCFIIGIWFCRKIVLLAAL